MKENKLTYEDAMSKLEALLVDLEDVGCTLNDSLEKFKQGINLYNYCSDILKKAEGEVKILLGDDKDSLDEFHFVKEDENDYY